MRKRKKLVLKKTTLRNLQPMEVRQAVGAITENPLACTLTCATWDGSCASWMHAHGCWCGPDNQDDPP